MMSCDYFEKFLQLKATRLAPKTLASYQDIIGRFLNPYFGEMTLEEITPLEVEVFLNTLLEAGQAPGSVKRIYAVRSALGKAAKLGLIRANPAGRDWIDPLPCEKKEIEIFTAAEVQTLLHALQGEPLHWRCFARIALDSGARRGELVALQWRDITSGKARTVRLTTGTLRLLEQLRKVQQRECLKAGTGWKSEYYIFGNKGAILHPTTPTGWWRKFLLRNSLPHRPLHALRHPYVKPTTKKYITFLKIYGQAIWLPITYLRRFILLFRKSPAKRIQFQSDLPERHRPC